jgi:hypothetical protein
VGEALDLGYINPRGFGDFFDRCSRSNAGLNILGTQHAFDLVVSCGLAQPRPIATHCGAKPVVYPDQEFVGGVATFADDVLTVDIESDESEFPHVDLLWSGI